MRIPEMIKFNIPDFIFENNVNDSSMMSGLGEEILIKKIKDTMKTMHFKAEYSEDAAKLFESYIDNNHKPFRMMVIISGGKINFKAVYPFRVQEGAVPIMAVNIIDFNSKTDYAIFNMDPHSGELSMEYSYAVYSPEKFDEKHFVNITRSIIRNMNDEYDNMAHVASGMVSEKKLIMYKDLLFKALDVIDTERSERTNYGIKMWESGDDRKSDCKKIIIPKEFRKNGEKTSDAFSHISRLLPLNNINSEKNPDIREVRNIIEECLSCDEEDNDDDDSEDIVNLSAYFEDAKNDDKN